MALNATETCLTFLNRDRFRATPPPSATIIKPIYPPATKYTLGIMRRLVSESISSRGGDN
jgi:hypothetical protein